MLYEEIGEKYLQIQMQTHSKNKHSQPAAMVVVGGGVQMIQISNIKSKRKSGMIVLDLSHGPWLPSSSGRVRQPGAVGGLRATPATLMMLTEGRGFHSTPHITTGRQKKKRVDISLVSILT